MYIGEVLVLDKMLALYIAGIMLTAGKNQGVRDDLVGLEDHAIKQRSADNARGGKGGIVARNQIVN